MVELTARPAASASLGKIPDYLDALIERYTKAANNVRESIDQADEAGDADTTDIFTEVSRGFMGALRSTTPVDPARSVMVAGDPQWKHAETRIAEGIPVGPGLLNQVGQIAQAAAAPWLLD